MPSDPLTLGIVTISYNQAEFLQQAIESVVVADPKRLEYVVVDAGSTDGSRDLITNDRCRFSALVFEPDAGPADGLNKGFSHCQADILGYLNADDRFSAGALDYVLSFFESNPDVDVIVGAVRIIDSRGKACRRRRVSWGFSAERYADGTCLALQQGTFFRRSAWEKTRGFNAENRTCWDAELLIDLALTGSRFRTVFKVLGEFRIHDKSITGSQRIVRQYQEDHDRITGKVRMHVVCTTPSIILILKQIAFKANPVRRILEWTVT